MRLFAAKQRNASYLNLPLTTTKQHQQQWSIIFSFNQKWSIQNFVIVKPTVTRQGQYNVITNWFLSSFRTWKHGLLLPGDTEQHVLRQFQLQPETSICLDVRTPAYIRHSSNFLHFQNFKGTLWFNESCLTLFCIHWNLWGFLLHQVDAWHSLE